MNIGLDLDGVVYPFVDGVRKFLVDCVGYEPEQLGPVTQWRMYEDWGMSEGDFRIHLESAVDHGLLFWTPGPCEGTREALQRLVDAGHTLHVVTARGEFGSPGQAERLTREWTEEYLPAVASLTFAQDKTVVRCDVFLEDRVENYDSLIHHGVRATLINQPWNQQVEEFPWRRRVDTVGEFVDDVLRLGKRDAA